MTGRFPRCGAASPTGGYANSQGRTTAEVDRMILQGVLNHEETAAAPQTRLELVLLTPYIVFGDELRHVEWLLNEEVPGQKLDRHVFRPDVPIFVQEIVHPMLVRFLFPEANPTRINIATDGAHILHTFPVVVFPNSLSKRNWTSRVPVCGFCVKAQKRLDTWQRRGAHRRIP